MQAKQASAGLEPATSRVVSDVLQSAVSRVLVGDQPTRCKLRHVSLPKRDVIRAGSRLVKTLVGVEPTWTGLQPVAVPSGSSV